VCAVPSRTYATVTASPGFRGCVNPITSSADRTGIESSLVTTSPVSSPAVASGPPAITWVSLAPGGEVESPSFEPTYACRAECPAASCAAIVPTVSEGIAKPTPLLLPDRLELCVLIPITRPLVSRSGPPELPGLIAASVWSASTGRLAGDSICWWRSLTMPVVRVPAWPYGLPIATTASPTCVRSESPSVSGCRSEAGAATRITARSVSVSRATTCALNVSLSGNLTVIECAEPATWSFVTMSPRRS
jgi:hypothetical protein